MRKSRDVLKYQSKNPLKRFLINHFLKKVTHEIKNIKPNTVLDLGCGEGFVEKYLVKKGFKGKILGIDMNGQAISEAKKRNPKLKFIKTDISNIKLRRRFDLVLMLEVLEHFERPQRAILAAKRLGKRIMISVPWEPWFTLLSLLSGRYVNRLGKHPGHLNFFSRKTLRDLLTKNFSYCEIKSSFPWLIAICEDRE